MDTNPCYVCHKTIKQKELCNGCEERKAYELESIQKGIAVPLDLAGYRHPYCDGMACSKCSEYPTNGGMCMDGSMWYDPLN